MPGMGLERAAASVFDLMGHYEPSRAINPSEGNDPVSLGMVPAAPAGREAAVPSAPPHADLPPMGPEPDPAGPIGQEVEERAEPDDLHGYGAYNSGIAADNTIWLESGWTRFRGKHFQLSGWAMATIITTLVHQLKEIYDAELSELYSIAAAMHEEERQRAALQITGGTEPNAVPPLPRAAEAGDAGPAGQPATTDVQPLLAAAPEERSVPRLRGRTPRKPTTKVDTRQAVSHTDAGAEA